jgi:hypothetical protein
MAAFPAIAYSYSQSAWYLRLPLPHVAIVYFYEGNDLNDNLNFLARRIKNLDAADLIDRIDRSIAAYPSDLPMSGVGWWRHLALLRFSANIVRRIFDERTQSMRERPKPDDIRRIAQADKPNIAKIAGQAIELPDNLQSPAMELTRPEMAKAALVFERSLVFLCKLLPHTPVLVAYLPSPLSSYQLLAPEVSIWQYTMLDKTRYPKELVAEYSNSICLLIRAATIAHGAGFLDLRPAIRAASGREILHGPRDFRHFNRKGMEVLGQTVAERLDQPLAQGSCANY